MFAVSSHYRSYLSNRSGSTTLHNTPAETVVRCVVLSLSYTQPLGISSVGCLKSRVQQFIAAFACGSHFQNWPCPIQSNRNGWEGAQQDLWANTQLWQHFPWGLTSQRGQSPTLGTARGAQVRCATCYTKTPPLLPHICCAEVTWIVSV